MDVFIPLEKILTMIIIAIAVVLFIVALVRRIIKKGKENFEDRDN